PKTERPKTERPKTERPKTGRPKTERPKTKRPETNEHPENHVRPENDGNHKNDDPDKRPENIITPYGIDNKKYNATIGDAMDWFKTMTTNAYIRGVKNNGWRPFNKKLWQRDYWDHIIRNQKSYERISEYIINNPKNWENDRLK
ncbi:MAG: hypothetical protein K9H15_08605, partial [Bacteroidales bacterium]|nr:hypothetical protein [Bacteroidales bacterium]